MKILLCLCLLSLALIFLIPQEVYAIDITATPQKINFDPNDWLRIDLSVNGYLGGSVSWTAHRPDNSTISGSLDQLRAGKTTHQIVRNAFDNYFGNWSITYTYNGVNQTASFVVKPITLSVKLDKELYYDGDIMKISLTTSYFLPTVTKAEYYHLNLYDKKGNLAKHLEQIDIGAYQSSTIYNFPIDTLVQDNPIGDYKIKVKYYNVTSEIPFEVGDIEKRTTIFVGTDKSFYQIGDSVDLTLIFSKVREAEGVIEITDPSGITSVKTFPVSAVSTKLHLEKIASILGKYRFEIHYAGVTESGSFVVGTGTIKTEPDIGLELELDKQKYRPGETIKAKIHTRDLIAEFASFWFEDPSGKEESKLAVSVTSGDTIVSYKINNDAPVGSWKMHVDYGGATNSAIFFVERESDDTGIINTDAVASPQLLFTLGYGNNQFKNPRDIAVDSENNVYIVDSGNSQIKKFDSNGKILASWGSFGVEEGQFKNPSGIFIDKKYVYVADTANARIQKFDKQGNFVYAWGTYGDEPGMFRTPVAVAASNSGDLFVSDSSVNRIFVFDSNGQYKDEIRSPLTLPAKFSTTNYIVFDSKNNFYIIVSNENKVLQYSSIGTFLKSFGATGWKEGQFNKPDSMTIDSDGNLYVTDTGNSRVQKFDSQGKFLVSWGTFGSGPGQFKDPVGIAVDSKKNVYVVDRANNNVQKFAPYDAPEDIVIPSWIKNNARWWAEDKIQDSDFAYGIQYLIKQKIINIPEAKLSATDSVKIPSWVKVSAGWWSDDKISDKSFVASIQYLVSVGIIKI